jgi:hypothetical protein
MANMPWLREFDVPIAMPIPIEGDAASVAASLVEAFPDGVTIEDPGAGRVSGAGAVKEFIEDSDRWLFDRAAQIERGPVTVGTNRTVAEYDVHLTRGGAAFVLPLAVAVERDDGEGSVEIRIYHSHWPLLGRHIVRRPLLPRDPDAREADVVGRYQAALAAGDTDAITATFEDDGCFREPAGPQYRVCGRENLRTFFAGFFSLGGGIVLQHCTVTDDGVRTALEFNAVRWGRVDMPHQAGIAVYERGRTGRLAHARIYDDVDPPLE